MEYQIENIQTVNIKFGNSANYKVNKSVHWLTIVRMRAYALICTELYSALCLGFTMLIPSTLSRLQYETSRHDLQIYGTIEQPTPAVPSASSGIILFGTDMIIETIYLKPTLDMKVPLQAMCTKGYIREAWPQRYHRNIQSSHSHYLWYLKILGTSNHHA